MVEPQRAFVRDVEQYLRHGSKDGCHARCLRAHRPISFWKQLDARVDFIYTEAGESVAVTPAQKPLGCVVLLKQLVHSGACQVRR